MSAWPFVDSGRTKGRSSELLLYITGLRFDGFAFIGLSKSRNVT